ncbi:hypothetical protein B0H14DRAFT_2575494 [Mycena olivaceomarginata]|nr:hypothetical protein B0H14DRAFT_2575494 [Mycena olivaceomarginata]
MQYASSHMASLLDGNATMAQSKTCFSTSCKVREFQGGCEVLTAFWCKGISTFRDAGIDRKRDRPGEEEIKPRNRDVASNRDEEKASQREQKTEQWGISATAGNEFKTHTKITIILVWVKKRVLQVLVRAQTPVIMQQLSGTYCALESPVADTHSGTAEYAEINLHGAALSTLPNSRAAQPWGPSKPDAAPGVALEKKGGIGDVGGRGEV